jgi:ATP-dependent protease HslVU (ClpYQ) peptidase subunit
MSTVIGIVDNGKVWMGADSFATTMDGERRRIVCKKIFTNAKYLIGFIGSVRTGQVIRPEYFTPPDDIMELPDAMFEQFTKKGCISINRESQVPLMEGNFLIATPDGKLFEILVDFQMNEIEDHTAIGSGSNFAVGSLYTTRNIADHKKRLLVALEAAALYDTSTGPPFIIEEFLEE